MMAIDRAAFQAAMELNDRGRACAQAGDLDGALSWYRQATQEAPGYEPAWFNMGLVFKQRRQWERLRDISGMPDVGFTEDRSLAERKWSEPYYFFPAGC